MKKSFGVIVASVLLIFLIYTIAELLIPLPFGSKSIEFEIKRGATFREAVELLAQKGLVRDKWVFLFLGRVTGIDRKVKAGYYPIWGSMSPWDIFKAFRRGQIIEYELTVVPGDSLLEIGEKLSGLGITDLRSFSPLSRDKDMLIDYDIDAPSLEGYLFPDTYKFPKGLSAREVISIMIERLRNVYNIEMLSRTYELRLTEKDVLTLASIIEKEAVNDEERPLIAAVYNNRLKKKMPLQADPTAIYGVKSSREKITREDLLRKTKYNTYIIRGLPPGPIASPGLKSILAALYPADVPYLYFVSNNDGTHSFSTSLSSHLDAVKAYRDKKKAKDKTTDKIESLNR